MKRVGVLLLIVILSSNICSSQMIFAASKFSDLPETHWARNNVESLADLGIINGYPDGTFKPSGTVTIAQFVKMTIVAMNVSVRDKVDGEAWYVPYIERANELVLLPSEFNALTDYDGYIQRDSMSTISIRALAILDGEIDMLSTEEEIYNAIADKESISDEYKQDITLAYGCGLITGYPNGNYLPDGVLSRAEASVVINRIISPADRKPYIDSIEEIDEGSYPVESSSSYIVHRTSYTTIETAVHQNTNSTVDFANMYEINSPTIDGVNRTESLDFIILFQEAMMKKYHDDSYNLLGDGVYMANKSLYRNDETIYNRYPDGLFLGFTASSHTTPINNDFTFQFSGISDLYSIWNKPFSPYYIPITIDVNMSNNVIDDPRYFLNVSGYESMKSDIMPAYMFTINNASNINDNLLDDINTAMEILFENDSTQVIDVLSSMLGSNITDEMRMEYVIDNGFEPRSGDTGGYFKGYQIGDRYLFVNKFALGMNIYISYKE